MLVVFISLDEIVDFIIRNQARTSIEFDQFRGILNKGGPVTFYNYECPIRSPLIPTQESREFECEWNIPDSVEKTRLVQFREQEKGFIDNVILPLRDSGFTVTYYKFVADMNPWLLYPESTNTREKERQATRIMEEFSQGLQNQADNLLGPGSIRIFPFSRIFNLFKPEYLEVYNQVRYSFKDGQDGVPETPFVRKKIVKNELDQLVDHCDIEQQGVDERVKELLKRVIASYAAEEYIIRTLLAKESWFQGPVAIPNEAMFEFPVLANAFLGRENRGPWLFVVYDQGEEIE